VWALFYPPVCLAAQVRISEAEWLTQAQEFGKAFVCAHTPEDVTKYLHIFVYHFGFFLATYYSIKKFANYKGKHSLIRHILVYSTPGFSYGPAELAH